jgi:branched-chain amino acid transport system substrate-binding protein
VRLGVAVGVVGALLLGGCGAVGNLVGEGDETGTPRLAKIVVLVPEDGELAGSGDAVADTVRSILDGLSVPRWNIEVERRPDGGQGATATAAAQEVAQDRDVIAVVGGLSAAAVRAAQPVLDRARIPFVSPADTAPEHTRGPDPAAPQRPYDTFFRVAVPGGDPIAYAAGYVVVGLEATTVTAIHDDRLDEAAAFARHARQLGARIVTEDTGAGDIAARVAAARAADVSAIYVGGDAAFAAEVVRAVRRARLEAAVVGGAELRSDDFLDAAGAAASGTVAVLPPSLASSDLREATHDSATALAGALERCLPAVRDRARDARQGCASEFADASFDGLTGTVSFDAFGERPGALPQLFVVTNGEWRPVGAL